MPTSQPFDETAKAFYRRFFENWGLVAETEREVFFRKRSIDLVVKCTEEQNALLQKTVFSHFRQLNAIEFKGINDPLTLADYNRIMMRAWGLGGLEAKKKTKAPTDEETDEEIDEETDEEIDEEIDEETDDTDEIKVKYYRRPSQRTLTIVCVSRPNKILDQLQDELGFKKTDDDGIYHCQDQQIPRWIIFPSELALVEKNYPLLPLARGDKLEQFLSLCLREGLVDYLQLIKDIGLLTDPDLIWRKILEVQQMKPQIREDTWPYIDQFFREIPEAMRKIPTFQEALSLNELRTQQRILIRLLSRKFASVPESVIDKIQATNNIDLLDNWLDQIISADSLANTGLIELH
jgi:hypothetical protein